MNNNADLLNRRDKTLEQRPIKDSIGKLRSNHVAPDTPRYSQTNGSFTGLFRIILILLLLINIMRILINPANSMTFTGFLQALRKAPTIEVGWLKQFNMWGTSLTSIPLIGEGLAFLTNIVSVSMFMATGMLQVGIYAVYFMTYIYI